MQKIIDQIDQELEFIRKFVIASTVVFEVKKENKSHILKMARSNHEFGIQHMQKEISILKSAKEVKGITHLVKRYPNLKDYKFIVLKEYFEGFNLEYQERINNPKLYQKLENTIKELHSLGIADLEINRQNIVFSYNEQDAKIIDLGFALLKEELNKSTKPINKFEYSKETDFYNLKKLFK